LAVALTSAALVASTPTNLVGTERMAPEAVARLTWATDSQMLNAFNCTSLDCSIADIAGSTGRTPHPVELAAHLRGAFECLGQSCLVADTAGSTGRTPMMKAEGASDADIKCIIEHNPPVGDLLSRYSNKPPDVPKQNIGIISSLMGGLNMLWRPIVAMTGSTEKGTFSGNCTKNILIFAKGTLEPGALGLFVGPALTSGLPSSWSSVGVSYDVDIPGDYCLGLPGGNVAKDMINQAAAKCPDSNLFLGGYSQGAMVVRNGLARADDSAKAKVKGVVTFGDPFNGANIKGYSGPISIFCNPGDGVCTGNFEVALAHLSYGGSTGQKALLQMADGKGDDNCCKPRPVKTLPTPEEWAKTLSVNGGKVPQAKSGTSVDKWEDALVASKGRIPS